MLKHDALKKLGAGGAMAATICFTAIWADTALAPPGGLVPINPNCESGCASVKQCPDGSGGVNIAIACAPQGVPLGPTTKCCAGGECSPSGGASAWADIVPRDQPCP